MKKNTHILPGITSFLQYIVGVRSDLDVSTAKNTKKIPTSTSINVPNKIDSSESLIVGT